MDHQDHIALIQAGIPAPGGIWADFGSGSGAFTLALADLLGPGGVIYSIDKDARALRQQEQALRARFPQVAVHILHQDYTHPLSLPPLDGALMANALHFQQDKESILRAILGLLRPGGRFILVEYNSDRGNPWVPHPLSFPTWQALAGKVGFASTRMLASRPSRFLDEIYAALSLKTP